jgi:hypothetical protein
MPVAGYGTDAITIIVGDGGVCINSVDGWSAPPKAVLYGDGDLDAYHFPHWPEVDLILTCPWPMYLTDAGRVAVCPGNDGGGR